VADEPRETRKEKREAARQARLAEQRRRKRAKRRKQILIGGTSGVLAVVLVVLLVGRISENRARSTEAVKQAAAAAGCDEIKQYPDAGAEHIDDNPEKRVPYTSNPPTSGDHFALGGRPPEPDFYTEPVQRPEIYVHNLEHGQIFIHYKDLPQDQVDELEEIQREHASSTHVMRNPEIDTPVAITAWRYMQKCQKVSKPVIERFIEERCNKSPERFTPTC
jgi:Protein of unknown function (DUF3105)